MVPVGRLPRLVLRGEPVSDVCRPDGKRAIVAGRDAVQRDAAREVLWRVPVLDGGLCELEGEAAPDDLLDDELGERVWGTRIGREG